MSHLPSDEEQSWLLEQLRDLIAWRGWETFVNAPIVEPSDTYFPDPFSRDTRGIYVLARRLLAYAGLGRLDVSVDVYPDGAVDKAEGTSHGWNPNAVAWFAGIENGRCAFGANIKLLQNLEQLPGAMAHEVAHAFRAFHRLKARDTDEEELLTDLTTIYLGFGVLTTNTTDLYRSSMEQYGSESTMRWTHQRLGYLPPQAMSFLLAAQAVARQHGFGQRRRIASLLETNQASYFRTAVKHLSRDAAGLAQRLGLPPRGTWPSAPRLRELVQPLQDVPASQSFEALPVPLEPNRREANRGRRVFRVKPRQTPRAVMLTALQLFGGATMVGALTQSKWALLIVPTGLVALWLNGRAKSQGYCSDPSCTAKLADETTSCPGCGGTVAGEIARPGDRLAAEDRLRELERTREPDDVELSG